MSHPDHLPRLRPVAYQGRAWVHWTMGIRYRACGWLNSRTHSAFRELLLHAGYRYHVHCPAYCLMPDHLHLLWMGASSSSDQRLAVRFLRRQWARILEPYEVKLQPQAFDRVLRDDERGEGSFEDTVLYIRKNPERAGLVEKWEGWEYGGAIIPGFPELAIFPVAEFWGKYWTVHHREVRRLAGDLDASRGSEQP